MLEFLTKGVFKERDMHKSLRHWPYRKVFLTGGTGLIGGQILREMLELDTVEEVSCLVFSIRFLMMLMEKFRILGNWRIGIIIMEDTVKFYYL